MKHYKVAAAILVENGEILCMQRNASQYNYVSFKYEFPGGKIELGESGEDALSRELYEEMDISILIQPNQYFMTVDYQYPDFKITMHSYLCPVIDRNFTQKEHFSHLWLKPDKLDTLDWAPADWPIVKRLMEECKTK